MGNWRKETLVDVAISLAFAARAIPGVLDHLEAAHTLSVASPACGGGMEAAITQLKSVVLKPIPEEVITESSKDGDSGSTVQDCAALSSDMLSGNQGDPRPEDVPLSNKRPICRSLWKGRNCENPESCERTHKPICVKEDCKTARNPTCLDWHYKPKKGKSLNRHPGNGNRGRSAPTSKPAKSLPKGRMSQETEKMYFKWKLSQMKLEQSQLAAATYRDILVSNPSAPSGLSRAHQPNHNPAVVGQRVTSGPAPQQVVPPPVATPPLMPLIGLEPIAAQLEAIVAALAAAGIMQRKTN